MTIHIGFPGWNRDEKRDWNQHKIETQKNNVPKSLYKINYYLFQVNLCLLLNDFTCIIGDGRVMIKTRNPDANRNEEGDGNKHKIETQKKVPESLYEIKSYLLHVHLCLFSNDFRCIIGDG